MAYIGQNADGNFTTSVSKDTFSGNDSTTAFTLSEGATTNTVDVFVENIRQEPTTAYTVDGTTLTFTAAPVTGTDNIYVVNRGPIQLSASHPAAQALTAHSATITTDLTVDTNTLFVDASADAVGIGNNSPSTYAGTAAQTVLAVGTTTGNNGVNVVSGATSTGSYMFSDSGGNDRGGLTYFHTADTLTVKTAGAERLRVLSGGGLTFNGDTAAANALDDYEEGDWTPYAISSWAAGLTIYDAHYTKIGNLVHITMWIGVSSISATAYNAAIGGLPYAAHSGYGNLGTALVYHNATTAITRTYIGQNQSSFNLLNNSANLSNTTNSQVGNSNIMANFTYRV